MSLAAEKIDPGQRGGRTHLKTGLLLSFIQVAGLLFVVGQDILAARLFGARQEMDGYLEAWVVPTILATVVGSGIQNALVPHFAHKRSSEGAAAAWELAEEAILASLGVFAVLTVLGLLGRPLVLGFTTSAISGSGASDIAKQIYPIGFLYAGCTLSASILGSVSASAGRFVLPTVLSNLSSIAPLVSLLLLGRSLGILALPLGLMVSAATQVVLLSIALGTLGLRLRVPRKGFLRRLLPLAKDSLAIALAGLAVGAIPILERHFASRLGEGAVSHLAYALKLVSAAVRALAAAVGVMGLPLLSSYLARGEKERFAVAFSLLLRVSIYLAVASLIGLMVAGKPLIHLLFERGRFTADDTRVVAALLNWDCLCLVFALAFPVLNAVILAKRQAWMLPILSLFGLVTYIGIAWAGMIILPTGAHGLAAAYGISFDLMLVLAGVVLASMNLVSPRALGNAVWRGVLAVPMILIPLWAVRHSMEQLRTPAVISLLVLGILGVGFTSGAVAVVDREVFGWFKGVLFSSLHRGSISPGPSAAQEP